MEPEGYPCLTLKNDFRKYRVMVGKHMARLFTVSPSAPVCFIQNCITHYIDILANKDMVYSRVCISSGIKIIERTIGSKAIFGVRITIFQQVRL